MARDEWVQVEQHLIKRLRQTPTGEWTKRYYVRFKDWKGVQRSFPAGPTLDGARDVKRIKLGDNSGT